MIKQHEVPTHLDVEDKLVFGLTVRQFLYMLVGSSISFMLWEEAAARGYVVRVGLVAVSVAMTLAFALLRIAGRPLEEWLVAAWMYVATPRSYTWQPREPHPADWLPSGVSWQEFAPSASWVEDESECA